MSGMNGLEIYFITGEGGKTEPLGTHNSYGIIIKASANAKTIAHEIGHACGWGDIYCKNGDNIITELYGNVKQSWMPADWGNGTGCRFYVPMLALYEIIGRLVMYGKGSDMKCDIPMGSVYGRAADGTLGNISVGKGSMLTTSPISL